MFAAHEYFWIPRLTEEELAKAIAIPPADAAQAGRITFAVSFADRRPLSAGVDLHHACHPHRRGASNPYRPTRGGPLWERKHHKSLELEFFGTFFEGDYDACGPTVVPWLRAPRDLLPSGVLRRTDLRDLARSHQLPGHHLKRQKRKVYR